MPIAYDNTPAGAVTEFGALGNGDWLHETSRGLCLKLDTDLLKRYADGGVESGIPADLAVTLVTNDHVNVTATPGATFGSLGNGSWFVDFTRGLCIKLNSDQLKRKSDGAVESGVDPNVQVIAKTDSEVNGTYDP